MSVCDAAACWLFCLRRVFSRAGSNCGWPLSVSRRHLFGCAHLWRARLSPVRPARAGRVQSGEPRQSSGCDTQSRQRITVANIISAPAHRPGRSGGLKGRSGVLRSQHHQFSCRARTAAIRNLQYAHEPRPVRHPPTWALTAARCTQASNFAGTTAGRGRNQQRDRHTAKEVSRLVELCPSCRRAPSKQPSTLLQEQPPV